MTTEKHPTEKHTTVTYADGVQKNFSERGKVFTDSKLTDNVITTTVYLNLVDNHGVGVSKSVQFDLNNPEVKEFIIATLATRGAEDFIKSAIAGLPSFADTVEGDKTVKGILSTVEDKISSLSNLQITTRTTGEGTVTPLTKLELAYAEANNHDTETPSGYKAVKDWYNTIPKSDRKLVNFPELSVAHSIVVARQKTAKTVAEYNALKAAGLIE